MERCLAVLTLFAPSAAMAHAGDHGQSGSFHLLSQADHLAMIALGVACVVLLLAKLRSRP